MINIQKTTTNNLLIARQCEQIAEENLIKNGGELQFSKTVYECDEIYYLLKEKELIGYVAIKYGYRLKYDAYIMQVAIKKAFQNQGFGSMLYSYIKQDIKNINCLTCDIRENNQKSISF